MGQVTALQVLLEWLDILWENNRTINRNSALGPKAITAATILHDDK